MQRRTLFLLAGVVAAAGLGVWLWQRRAHASGGGGMVKVTARSSPPGLAPTPQEQFEIAANPQERAGHNRF